MAHLDRPLVEPGQLRGSPESLLFVVDVVAIDALRVTGIA
jgi:hypothetical protein